MMAKCALILVVLGSLQISDAFKILAVFPMPSPSHSILGDGYAKLLLEAGHEVSPVYYHDSGEVIKTKLEPTWFLAKYCFAAYHSQNERAWASSHASQCTIVIIIPVFIYPTTGHKPPLRMTRLCSNETDF